MVSLFLRVWRLGLGAGWRFHCQLYRSQWGCSWGYVVCGIELMKYSSESLEEKRREAGHLRCWSHCYIFHGLDLPRIAWKQSDGSVDVLFLGYGFEGVMMAG